jgi:hypothetical protein
MQKTAPVKRINRRKSERRRPRGNVHLECRKGSYGLGPNIAAGALDLSDTGVRLIVTQELDALSEAEIIISGYGMKKSIKRLGCVRWQLKLEDGRYCIGVEFFRRIDYREWQNLASPN